MADEAPEAWGERLRDADLPPAVAVHYARCGTSQQRYDVARNSAAPVDAQLLLAADPDDDVAAALLSHDEAATEVVAVLQRRFPGDRLALTHPSSPVGVLLDQPLWELVTATRLRFFEEVRATEAERLRLQQVDERFGGRITLGRAWQEVRTHRWPPRPATT